MKIAFWSYVIGQGLLVGAAVMDKLSIWISLIPTFTLISLSAGIMCLLLMLEFMFNHMGDDDCFGLGKIDDDGDDEDEKDSE
jgi:hypothetical protein